MLWSFSRGALNSEDLCRGRVHVKLAQHVRAALVQNETAPEKLLNRYEKRFEKREQGSEK